MPVLRPPSRRGLFTGTLAGAALAGLPRAAHAASGQRRFLFLTCFGGWDPTRVFVPAFDDDGVDMELEAEPLTIGDNTFVDHPRRPNTRTLLQGWGDRMALVHGFLVPSVAHMACLRLVRTGYLAGHADWPAILASGTTGEEPLPHLVLSGPSYPDVLSPYVARTGAGGQLEALLDGSIVEWTGRTPAAVTDAIRTREDTLVAARRTAALARNPSARHQALLQGHADADARVRALTEAAAGRSWASDGSFTDDALVAVEMLSQGICRCASVAHPSLWDSHSANDIYQSILWEDLSAALTTVFDALATTPGPAGGVLLDETVVVLMSEMGRAPKLNSTDGKDHWPYATAMLLGAGIAGGTHAGAYDAGLLGARVDAATGEADAAGEVLSSLDLGATLLHLGDADPDAWVPDGAVLESVLR